MKALVLGGGSIGCALIEQLYSEGWDITIVENDPEIAGDIAQKYDVLVEEGDARDFLLLERCNIETMDAVFSVTGGDEINILTGAIAKKKGVGFAAVRIGGAIYSNEYIKFIKDELGVDLVFDANRLYAQRLFDRCTLDTGAEQRRSAVISGGGMVAAYLSDLLVDRKYKVTIISDDREECDSLLDFVDSSVMVVKGDINEKAVADELALDTKGAFIAVNEREAANIVLAKYADIIGVPYTAAMAIQNEINSVGRNLGIDEIITSGDIAHSIIGEMKSGASLPV